MVKKFLFFILILLSLQICANTDTVKPEAKTQSADIKELRSKWLDSKLPAGIDPAELTPDEIKKYLETKTTAIDRWFTIRGDTLLRSMVYSTIILFATLLVWYLLKRLTDRKIKDMKKSLFFWELLHALNSPVLFGIMLTGVFLSFLPVLNSFSQETFLYDVRFFFTTLTLTAAWGAMNLVGLIDERLKSLAKKDNNALDDLMVKLLRNIMRILVFVTAVLFIGQSIFKVNITALLAGAGVVGLGAALAAKDTLSNFFGTIVILFDRPFKLGDKIKVGDVEGIVTEVGMRSSKIMAEDESIYTLPNSLLTTQPVKNVNYKNHLKVMFDVTMTYDTTDEEMSKAMRILHELTDNFKGADRPGYGPRIFFSSFADSSMNITVILWLKTESFAQEEEWLSELNLLILKRFNEENLNMAFPTTTSYLLTAKDAPLAVRLENGKEEA